MSLQVPNINDYIERIASILENSALLMPNSAGGDETQTDLVNQIFRNELPIPQQPLTGEGPPHIFIKESTTPVLQKVQLGRNSLDAQGPEEVTLEFYCVVVTQGTTYQDSQVQMNTIRKAIATTLKTNMRLLDKNKQNPLCNILDLIDVPYLLDSDEKTVIARNIVIRPKVFVNLRS